MVDPSGSFTGQMLTAVGRSGPRDELPLLGHQIAGGCGRPDSVVQRHQKVVCVPPPELPVMPTGWSGSTSGRLKR